jgi:CubicO group peptidase (beta-lactamase class C family)
MSNKQHRVSRAVRGWFLGLVFTAASASAQTSQAPHVKLAAEIETAIARIDQLYAAEYARHPQASVTIGVVSGGKLVWTKSYGLADIENNAPATKDTVYRIGSVTKQFTGLMLLQLVQQGKVHLSDPVKKYFPEFERIPNPYTYSPPVTLLQLATHTSGLDAQADDVEKYTKGPVADWEKTLISALPHTRFKYEPGTHFSYSNIGYVILGEALSRAAGEPYIQYVQEHIFQPLGMTHTAFEQNDEIMKTLAKGYMMKGGSPDSTQASAEFRDGRGYTIPSGAAFSTVGDMAKFVSFEMQEGPEDVLPRTVLADNFSRVYSADSNLTRSYGIGFGILRYGDLIETGHNGGLPGYHAEIFFDRASRTGFIFLRNVGGGPGFGNELLVEAMKALAQ